MADKIREKNVIILCGIICTTLVICGILFWPTLYRYDNTTRQKIVRINRITGYTEMLYPSHGWEIVKREKESQLIPLDKKAKIKMRGASDGEGNYKFAVYNGSDWTLKKNKIIFYSQRWLRQIYVAENI